MNELIHDQIIIIICTYIYIYIYIALHPRINAWETIDFPIKYAFVPATFPLNQSWLVVSTL